jgi:hypothetical protein
MKIISIKRKRNKTLKSLKSWKVIIIQITPKIFALLLICAIKLMKFLFLISLILTRNCFSLIKEQKSKLISFHKS